MTNSIMTLMSRRTVLRGATVAAAAFACVPVAVSQEAPRGGCAFCNLDAPDRAMSFDELAVTRSTGDAETDRFLGRAIARLSRAFDVSPRFAFFDDSKAPNAYALRDDNAVVMGKRLFRHFMEQAPDGMIVVGILAHEFGHIHQYQHGYQRPLAAMCESVMPAELHADFLAGYYLALRKTDHPQLDLQAVGRAFDNLGDTDFGSPKHHGTNAQRIASVTTGFEFGRGRLRQPEEVAQAGFAYVKSVV